jgi:hypothetical protein
MLLYRERGVLDPQPTISAPNNELLFKVRSPALLRAGDGLFLPIPGKRGEKRLPLSLGEENQFRVQGHARRLRLTLKHKGSALGGTPFRVDVAGVTVAGSTDDSGMLDAVIPFDASEARLVVDGRERGLVLGGLDPLHTVTGIQARLANLGFHLGAIDGVVGALTRRAIRRFQKSRSLLVDGIVGPKTRDALRSAYGE